MATKKKFDVFISHNSVDKPWVVKLKGDLEAQSVKVWLDKDEIRPGDVFAAELEAGIAASKCVALIVSPESMKSGWVKAEYYRAIGLATANKQPLRIIPVILRSAGLPGFLSDRLWVDFRDEANFKENVKQLVWGITGQKEKPNDVIEIPFVIAAMTKKQAKDLFNGKTKNSIAFAELKTLLCKQISSDDLLNSYGKNSDDWEFPLGGGEKISTVIKQTLEDLNIKIQEAKGTITYVPKSTTIDFFSKDKNIFTETIRQFKHSGCMLVVDSISLFHEDISERLRDLQIDLNDNVATVVVSPLDAYANPVIKILDKKVKDHLQIAFLNFANHMDRKYEFGIGNLVAFKRWVYVAIPEMSDTQKARSANRDLIRQHMGSPVGMDNLIFRPRGTK